MDRHKILLILSKRIYRTVHTGRPAVEEMGVRGASGFGRSGTSADRGLPVRPGAGLVRVEITFLRGVFVPVIPLPLNHDEAFRK